MTDKSSYFIFRVDLGKWGSGRDLEHKLEEAGVAVDRKFGRIPIDTEGRNHILRGVATDSIVARLKSELDIDAFADMPVSTRGTGEKI